MNKIFRIVFNRTTGRWVVASEVAKGRTKAASQTKNLLAAAITVGALGVTSAASAGQPNSYISGVINAANGGTCISSTNPGALSSGTTTCDSGGGTTQAAMVSYDSAGKWGAYITVADPNTVRLGAGGADKLRINGTGLTALDTLSMSSKKITSLAAGSVASNSSDAINGDQLFDSNTAIAAALGTTVNSTTGYVDAPSYALTNANTIGGSSGAATDVGGGFAKVDAALGKLNTTANKGFNISADAGATSQNIAPGGTVKYAAGSNATVSRSGDTITYGVAANPTFSGNRPVFFFVYVSMPERANGDGGPVLRDSTAVS